MALKQSINQARPANFAEVLARTGATLASLRARHADRTLPLLRLPEQRDDLATILGYATLLRDGTSDVIFLGTGGSRPCGENLGGHCGPPPPRGRAPPPPPPPPFIGHPPPPHHSAPPGWPPPQT